jgi:large subunit ribosomal protein L30
MAREKVKDIKITQIKSAIGSPKPQKLTIEALGIKKLNHSKVHKATPQILGMVNKVKHLVKVEEV